MDETRTFRFLISGWLALSAVTASPMGAFAADYPSRPLRLVVPFPPAGAADILAREISPKLSAALRQQIIVDNRPGANRGVARQLEAQGPPSSFAEAYLKWKARHNMSAFQSTYDADVLAAVAAGDCSYANGAIFQYGRVNLPGAEHYSDSQVIAYGETVDKLVDACQRDKVARTTWINTSVEFPR